MTQTDTIAALSALDLDALAGLVGALGTIEIVDVEINIDEDICSCGAAMFSNGECANFC